MKRLVFCFDGTWNRIDAAHSTNVVMTAESVLPLASSNVSQLIYYHEGVGTGRWDRIRGGVFGTGLVQNLADAYRFLIFNHTPGDEIYVFGFSRGAYTARSFVGLIGCCGILLRKDAGKVKDAVERYRERDKSEAYAESMMRFRLDHSPQISISEREDEWRAKQLPGSQPAPRLLITYLGVWDTVGALGIPASFTWLSWAILTIGDRDSVHGAVEESLLCRTLEILGVVGLKLEDAGMFARIELQPHVPRAVHYPVHRLIGEPATFAAAADRRVHAGKPFLLVERIIGRHVRASRVV